MIRPTTTLNTALSQAKADVDRLQSAVSVYTTLGALEMADQRAANAIKALQEFRVAARALAATERKRLRDEAKAREASDARRA